MHARRLMLRTRIALVTSGLIAAVALAVFFYLPQRLEATASTALEASSHSVAEIAAYGIAETLAESGPVQAAPILRALQRHEDLVYIILRSRDGALLGAINESLAERAGYLDIPREPQRPERGVPRPGSARGPGAARAATETAGGYSATEPVFQVIAPVRRGGRTMGDVYLGFSTRHIQEETAAARGTAALLGVTILILGMAASFGLATLITAPISRIVATTERIASGARGERAPEGGDDEVGQLSSSFNAMVEKLETARLELEAANQSLEARVERRTTALLAEVEERKRAEIALRESEEKYRLLIERNLAGVYITRMDGTLVSANPACAAMFGFDSVEELLAQGTIAYVDPVQRERFLDRIRTEGAVTNFEVQITNRKGDPVWALENARTVPQKDLIEGILLDITDRKRTELEIEYRAYHDPLTDLPNRMLLRDRLNVAVARAKRFNEKLAILFLDVDDLKGINDTLGHQVGDQVLQAVGRRLTESVRAEDTVARIGGDEFAVVLTDLESEENVTKIAESILAGLEQHPITLRDEEIRVTASVGAALFPRDGEDPDTLLRNADATMYHIKEKGGRGFQIYNQHDSSRSLRRSSLEKELREGIDRGEFELHFQPQYHLQNRRMSGAEALVRWKHPEGLVVKPMGFINLAEQTGLIIPLGELLIRNACRTLKRWQDLGAGDFCLGVNISARQFHQRNFLGIVREIVEGSGIEPTHLEFEITESVAVQKSGFTINLLRGIRDLGVRVAVDDFGTGRSSLVYLRNFDLDTIKIDQEFVRGMSSSPHDQSIVTAILLLARKLELRTIAEGVETEEACEILRRLGCGEAQGYLFAHPLPIEEFEPMLMARIAEAKETPLGSATA